MYTNLEFVLFVVFGEFYCCFVDCQQLNMPCLMYRNGIVLLMGVLFCYTIPNSSYKFKYRKYSLYFPAFFKINSVQL